MRSAMTLDEVAQTLGVHYMTVYRYVRQGRLQAVRTHGVWQVSPEALAEFRRERNARTKRRPPSGDARRRGNYVVELERCLEAGDAGGAWDVLERAMSAGADVDEVYLEILSPVLRTSGSAGPGESWRSPSNIRRQRLRRGSWVD